MDMKTIGKKCRVFSVTRNKCNFNVNIVAKTNRYFGVLMLTYHVLYNIITSRINSWLQEEFLVNVFYKWQFVACKARRYFLSPFIGELISKWTILVTDRLLLINFILLFSLCWTVSSICQVNGNLKHVSCLSL